MAKIIVESSRDGFWVLGDPNRQSSELSLPTALAFLGLDPDAISLENIDNGVRVTVQPQSRVARMLTSLNDDVGTAVRYSTAVPPHPDILEALGDQKITVEFVKPRGSRLVVYPEQIKS